jgi:hypothetical protein
VIPGDLGGCLVQAPRPGGQGMTVELCGCNSEIAEVGPGLRMLFGDVTSRSD